MKMRENHKLFLGYVTRSNVNEKLRIASILITFLLAAYSMYAITFVLIPLHLSFNVSLAFITVAVTLSWIGGGIGGFIFGYISDIFGKKNTVLITILMYSISTILIFFINNIYQLYVLMFFVGAGVNGENGISYVLISFLQKTRLRGTIGGFMQGLYALGALLGAITASTILPRYGTMAWRYVFLITGIVSLFSLISWLFIPDFSNDNFGKHRMLNVTEIFNRNVIKLTLFGSIFAFASFMFLIPLFSLAPTYLQDYGMGSYYIIYVGLVLASLVYGLSGYISDKIGRKRTVIYFSLMAIIFSALFLYVNYEFLGYFIPVSLVLIYMSSSFFAFYGVWISELYPPKMRGAGSNFTLLVARILGGGFGPLIVVLIPLKLGVSLGTILFIMAVVALISSIFIKKPSNQTSNVGVKI